MRNWTWRSVDEWFGWFGVFCFISVFFFQIRENSALFLHLTPPSCIRFVSQSARLIVRACCDWSMFSAQKLHNTLYLAMTDLSSIATKWPYQAFTMTKPVNTKASELVTHSLQNCGSGMTGIPCFSQTIQIQPESKTGLILFVLRFGLCANLPSLDDSYSTILSQVSCISRIWKSAEKSRMTSML